ncbi:MAG TPA: formate dehydrogenase accessory protein FdhE [Blastocatellia bacterium]|nr:formate dehydrogenase accessory protein FdhE [Blastocatellia bacterium]
MKESWDKWIQRAEKLASEKVEAKELLTFYAKLLSAQKDVYEYLCSRKDWLPSGLLERDLPVVRPMMTVLLNTVESSGPAQLADEAHALIRAREVEIDGMLLEYWSEPSDLQFFAKAFLQPYARWLAETGVKPVNRSLGGGENRCPFCDGKPQLSFLQTPDDSADGGGRALVCSVCLTAWPFGRVVCANCLEEYPAKLSYFHSPHYDHVRVECCETCKHYIKGVDLTRLGLAVPLVDEIAAAPLDLWAHEHGYTKIELNLIGL